MSTKPSPLAYYRDLKPGDVYAPANQEWPHPFRKTPRGVDPAVQKLGDHWLAAPASTLAPPPSPDLVVVVLGQWTAMIEAPAPALSREFRVGDDCTVQSAPDGAIITSLGSGSMYQVSARPGEGRSFANVQLTDGAWHATGTPQSVGNITSYAMAIVDLPNQPRESWA